MSVITLKFEKQYKNGNVRNVVLITSQNHCLISDENVNFINCSIFISLLFLHITHSFESGVDAELKAKVEFLS